jgi:cytochrome b
MMSRTTETTPHRVLVWDLPTRLLHWLLAASFLGAFAVAVLFEHRNPAFAVHMLLGAIAALVVLLRIAWGFVGSRYARFRSFAFGPRAVVAYVRDAFAGRGEPHVGHNPANGWAAYAMLVATLGVAVTGALIARGGHAVKEIHELFAYAMVGLAAVHVAGVALHVIRRRDNIALGMIDGRRPAAPAQAIETAHPLVALVMVGLVGAWAGSLVHGYDATGRRVTLPALGQSIQLGERKEAGAANHRGEHRARHRDD